MRKKVKVKLRELALDDARTRCHATYLPPPQVFDHLLNMFFFSHLPFLFNFKAESNRTDGNVALDCDQTCERIRETRSVPAPSPPSSSARGPSCRRRATTTGGRSARGRRNKRRANKKARSECISLPPSVPPFHDHQS